MGFLTDALLQMLANTNSMVKTFDALVVETKRHNIEMEQIASGRSNMIELNHIDNLMHYTANKRRTDDAAKFVTDIFEPKAKRQFTVYNGNGDELGFVMSDNSTSAATIARNIFGDESKLSA